MSLKVVVDAGPIARVAYRRRERHRWCLIIPLRQQSPAADRSFVGLPDVGDETLSLVVVHSCHETTCVINDVLFYLIDRWSAIALHRSPFRRNEILMVPLRIARNIVPSDENLIAEYPSNGPVRESPIAQAYRLTYFERVRFCVRPILRNSVTLNLGRVCSVYHFGVPRGSRHYTSGNLYAKRPPSSVKTGGNDVECG